MMHVPLAALLAALLLRTTAIFKFSRGLMNRLTTRVLLNNNVLIAHVNVFSAKDPFFFLVLCFYPLSTKRVCLRELSFGVVKSFEFDFTHRIAHGRVLRTEVRCEIQCFGVLSTHHSSLTTNQGDVL
jgi:hypothetical protein